MAWPIDPRDDGDLISEIDWNEHVDALNELNTRLTSAQSDLDLAEGNISTLQSGLSTVTTNLGTRGSLGTAYSEITTLRNAVGIPWSGGTALSRITTLESRTTDSNTGNTALGNRLASVEDLHARTVLLRKSAAQSIPNGTTNGDTLVTWDVVETDPAGLRSGNAINLTPGTWYLSAQIRFDPSTAGTERDAYIVNYSSGNLADIGTKVVAGLGQTPNGGGIGNLMSFGKVVKVTTTTPFVVAVWHNTGGNLNISSTTFGGCSFSAFRMV